MKNLIRKTIREELGGWEWTEKKLDFIDALNMVLQDTEWSVKKSEVLNYYLYVIYHPRLGEGTEEYKLEAFSIDYGKYKDDINLKGFLEHVESKIWSLPPYNRIYGKHFVEALRQKLEDEYGMEDIY